MAYLSINSKGNFVTGASPIPALACPDTPELVLPSNHRYGYDHSYRLGFSPAFSRICPAPASGMLAQYPGW